MTIRGLGGCPFAQDALLGNIATEVALKALHQAGAALPKLLPLEGLMAATETIAARFGPSLQ